jgi:hypothetical protein
MYCTFELTASPQKGDASSHRARLSVEGTIVGDGRKWDDLTMTWSDDIPVVVPREAGGEVMTVVTKIQVDRMGKSFIA